MLTAYLTASVVVEPKLTLWDTKPFQSFEKYRLKTQPLAYLRGTTTSHIEGGSKIVRTGAVCRLRG